MTTPISNIDIDMSQVNLARPLIDNQIKLCKTGNVVVEAATDKRGAELVIPLTLEEPATDTNGATVQVGFTHAHRIGLDPKGNRTLEMIQRQLGTFMVAALDLKDANGKALTKGLPNFRADDLSPYCGRDVRVLFATRPDKNDPNRLFQDVKGFYQKGS